MKIKKKKACLQTFSDLRRVSEFSANFGKFNFLQFQQGSEKIKYRKPKQIRRLAQSAWADPPDVRHVEDIDDR